MLFRSTSTTSSGATVQSTIFNVGKQLSNRWYVGYERSINAATGLQNPASTLSNVTGSIYAGQPRTVYAGVKSRF